ncbi:hypothetical protein DSO57_1011670 [Entomophthora muscae]|uniref:Uncharacterized protein n=1 Tax=Entomophthora muscae TaxID=34485 RepID=A0ACC2RXD7_9FUNG|nr:hypothetical protein DSO57_1011670 [Entomophthora muscae]
MVKAVINSFAAPWPTLYKLPPMDSSSNLSLQIIGALKISISIFCYTTTGSKMLKLFSQFDLLLFKQLKTCVISSSDFFESCVLPLYSNTLDPLIWELLSNEMEQSSQVEFD